MNQPPAADDAEIALLSIRPNRGSEASAGAWLVSLQDLAARARGFVNAELLLPSVSQSTGKLSLRFRDQGALAALLAAPAWKALLSEGRAFVAQDADLGLGFEKHGDTGGVVEVVITSVKPGFEDAYRDWESRAQRAQAAFPGYLGAKIQPPLDGGRGWTTTMTFERAEQLEAWLKSAERAALLRDVEPMVDYAHLQRVDSAFPGWIPNDPRTGKAPPNWKAAMLVLLGLFPIVMLEARFLGPVTSSFNASLAMFIGNVISVALTSFITMPLFVKWFDFWLYPTTPSANLRGTLIIVVIYAIEVLLLWNLL